jgi:hypothetical membrane protein
MKFKNSTLAGSLFLLGSAQFAIALVIAESIYPGYSVAHNYVSDLGVWENTSALIFNPSIIVFGLCIITGAYFLRKHFGNTAVSALFALAGLGALGVGVFPENIIIAGFPYIHRIFAATTFVFGGLSGVFAYKIVKGSARFFAVCLGVLTLGVVAVFVLTEGLGCLGLGIGGMERIMTYLTILLVTGCGGYLLGLGYSGEK